MHYRFSGGVINPQRRVLVSQGAEVSVEPQVFDVLLFLVENRGRVVTKEELLDGVWGDRFVSESALTSRIKAARRAVGDDGRSQHVIRTVHRRGYEFIAAVDEVEGDPAEPTDGVSHVVRDGGDPPPLAPSLIGRDKAVTHLVDAMPDERLVTLVGPGGVGKTSLALAVCQDLAGHYPDGVWTVELVAVTPDAVVDAVATALDVQGHRGRSLLDSLIDVLRTRTCLVLFDNCEHVVEQIGDLTSNLLRNAAGVSIVATSREPLGLALERLFPVEPLPVELSQVDDAVAALDIAGIRLFAERAAAADRSFELTDENLAAVAEICRRLDGIPLAIELAAARVRNLGIDNLSERLDARFRVLKSSRRDADVRHRTLLDTVQWSYDLLTDDEQDLFQRLTVFSGQFDLASAEAVCDPDDEGDVLDGIDRLADRSMLAVRPAGTSVAYELLETMRDFGRGLVPPDVAEDLTQRHAAYFVAEADRAALRLESADEGASLAATDTMFANYRAAQRRAAAAADVDGAMRLAVSMREYGMRTMRYEMFGWADVAIDLPGANDHELYPLATALQGYGSWVRGLFDLSREQCAAATLAVSDDDHEARHLIARTEANVHFILGDYDEGTAACARMRECADASGRASMIAHANYMSAVAHGSRELMDEAEAQCAVAVEAAARSGSPTAAAGARFAEGIVAAPHDEQAALEAFRDSVRLAVSVGNRWMDAFARTELNGVLLGIGRVAQAAGGFAEVLDAWYRSGDWAQQWLTVSKTIGLLAEHGDQVAAAELVGAVEARASLAPVPSMAGLRSVSEEAVDRLRSDLDDDAFEQAIAAGASRPIDEIMDLARRSLFALA